MIDWRIVCSATLALILASLIEHMFIAPRMAHSPANEGIGALPNLPTTVEERIKLEFPDAITVNEWG